MVPRLPAAADLGEVPAHAVMAGGASLGDPELSTDEAPSILPKHARVTSEGGPWAAYPSEHTAASEHINERSAEIDAGTVWAAIERIQAGTAEQHQFYLGALRRSHEAFLDLYTQMMAMVAKGACLPCAEEIPWSQAPPSAAEMVGRDTARGSRICNEGVVPQNYSRSEYPISAGLRRYGPAFRNDQPTLMAMAGLCDRCVVIAGENPAFTDTLAAALNAKRIMVLAVDDVPDHAVVICLAALADTQSVNANPDTTELLAGHALCRLTASTVVVADHGRPRLYSASLVWRVSTLDCPALEDHQIGGRVVVPVVIVLDAILRAAQSLIADSPTVLRDFQVLSGVTFAVTEYEVLKITFRASDSSYSVTLDDRGGRTRYRADLDTASDTVSVLIPKNVGSPWPIGVEEAYGGLLFHGRRFAAIERLESLSEAGGTAILKSRGDLGWAEDTGSMDPAMVDGGLQLCLLWVKLHGRSLMLPQRIGRLVIYEPFPDNSSLRCRFAAHPVSDKRVEFDLVFETTQGRLVAALAGVEFYAVPSDVLG